MCQRHTFGFGDLRPALIAAALACVAIAAPRAETCSPEQPCKIAVKRLSSEAEHPFLVRGEPPRPGSPHYDDYRQAIARFPDVRACLVADERDKAEPDLNRIDWDAIGALTEADVCLFRIFASIADPEGAKRWLANDGFQLGLTRVLDPPAKDGATVAIDASWSIDRFGAKFARNIFHRWWQQFVAYGLSVTARFTADGDVTNTQTLLNTL